MASSDDLMFGTDGTGHLDKQYIAFIIGGNYKNQTWEVPVQLTEICGHETSVKLHELFVAWLKRIQELQVQLKLKKVTKSYDFITLVSDSVQTSIRILF